MPSIWKRIKGLFGITFGVPGAETWQFAQDWVRGLFRATSAVDEPYKQHSTVATGLSILTEDAASVGWELFREGQDDPLEDHALLDFWKRPNECCTGLQLWIGTYLSRQLFGEAFWYYPDIILTDSPGGADRPVRGFGGELQLLDPRAVMHKVNADGSISWALKRRGMEDMPLDPDSLTHFKRYNPYDAIRGLSVLTSVMIEISGDQAAAAWNERFFSEQNGIPSGVLTPQPGSMLSDDQRQDVQRTFRQRHGSGKRSVLVLPGGWSYEAMGVDHAKMGFGDLRDSARELILGAIGVPPFRAGVLDKANYANARQQDRVYWNGPITRLLDDVAQTINADFLPKVGLQTLEAQPRWDVIHGKTEDLAEKAETAKSLFSIGVPLEQINERLKLGLDTKMIPTATVSYLPMNLLPADMLDEPVTVAGPAGAPPAEDEDAPPAKRLLSAVPHDREARRAMVWRGIIARTRDIELRFRKMIRSYFKDLEQETLAKLNGAKGMAWVHRGIVKQDEFLYDLDEAQRELVRRAGPLHKEALKRGGKSIILDLGLATTFDLNSPRVLAKLAEIAQAVSTIPVRLHRDIREELIEGLNANETLAELSSRLSARFDIARGRSLTIARTETGYGYNAGRNESMRQNGIQRQQWLTARDPDVRDSHSLIDGETVAMGEAFGNGLLYPNDPSGPAEEIINCRCVALPVVE